MTQETIPGYVFKKKLGAGGTATVFLADDVKHARTVAVKVLHPQKAKDAAARERFEREAKLLVQFDHPHIVRGYDQGIHSEIPYVVMEFCEGTSVQELIDRQGAMPESDALDIVLQLADAMAYMQWRGYVHKDIKPHNILMAANKQVKLCDLGFAQPIRSEPGGAAAETTSGTAHYMSPEQAQGERDIDIRSDIYSLGATLYHMVIGETPFRGTDNLELMASHVLNELDSSEVKNRRLSRHMHYFIERMMAKDKEMRYRDPKELMEDIGSQLEGFRTTQVQHTRTPNRGRTSGPDPRLKH